jgi:hypothetical protein
VIGTENLFFISTIHFLSMTAKAIKRGGKILDRKKNQITIKMSMIKGKEKKMMACE